MFRSSNSLFFSSICVGLTAAILAGCSSSRFPSSRTTIELCSGSARMPVPDGDILSLLLTVTKIEFQRCDGGDDDDGIWTVDVNTDNFDPTSVTIRPGGLVQWIWTADGEHTITGGESAVRDNADPFEGTGSMEGDFFKLIFEGEDGETFPYFSNNQTDIDAGMAGSVILDEDAVDDGDHGTGGFITVFEGMHDFDLVDPTEICEVLSSVDIPSGRYCKIRLHVENPRLLLAEDAPFDLDDPPYRTNVKLTANGRLFIGTSFELEPDGESLIKIMFQGVHLVETGDMFVLTPQLLADVEVFDADI